MASRASASLLKRAQRHKSMISDELTHIGRIALKTTSIKNAKLVLPSSPAFMFMASADPRACENLEGLMKAKKVRAHFGGLLLGTAKAALIKGAPRALHSLLKANELRRCKQRWKWVPTWVLGVLMEIKSHMITHTFGYREPMKIQQVGFSQAGLLPICEVGPALPETRAKADGARPCNTSVESCN